MLHEGIQTLCKRIQSQPGRVPVFPHDLGNDVLAFLPLASELQQASQLVRSLDNLPLTWTVM